MPATTPNLHPLWSTFLDPERERRFRNATHGDWATAAARFAVLATALFTVVMLVEPTLRTDHVGVALTVRILLVAAALALAYIAENRGANRQFDTALTIFLLLGLLALQADRWLLQADDPLPGGVLTGSILYGATALNAFPLRAPVKVFLGTLLLLSTTTMLGLTDHSNPQLLSGVLTVAMVVVGSVALDRAQQRERRFAWHTNGELRRANAQIQRLLEENLDTQVRLRIPAEHDPLTGALNRRSTHAIAERILADEHQMSVLAVDLDHFKRVNDTWGHAGGDAALQHVVEWMRGSSRPGDAVARWGGDELLLVVRDNTGTTGREIARRLHDRSQQEEVQHGDQRFSITLSIGIAWGGGVGFEDLLQEADLALFLAM